MNITYTKDNVETKPKIKDLPVGTVIECEGVKMLLIEPMECKKTIQNKGILLLNYESGDDWFELNNSNWAGKLENGDFKVLGRIVGLELERL